MKPVRGGDMFEPKLQRSFADGTFEERLEHALAWFIKGGGYSRTGLTFALAAVHGYVREHAFNGDPKGDRLLEPLDQLFLALIEIENGRSHPLFEVDKTSGGSALLIDRANFQILSCFMVDLLESSGLDRTSAVDKVAHSLSKSGFRQIRKDRAGNLKNITGDTVLGWCKDRDRIAEASSFGEYKDALEFVLLTCRGYLDASVLEFNAMTPDAAVEKAELILEQAIPIRFGYLRPGP